MAGKQAGYDSSSGYAVHPGMGSYPDGHGYIPAYGSVPGMGSYSNGYVYYSSYDSYPAMDGNSTYPVVDENSTGYSDSSDSEDDSILDAQHRSGSKDPNISPTSFSSPSVNRSAPTHGSLSPAPPGDTKNPIQPNPSRRGHTQLSRKSTGAICALHCLHRNCDYETKRQYDLDRHQKTHLPSNPVEKFDCTGRGCGRTGEYGFNRKDHLREHLIKAHGKDIPKQARRSN